MEIVFPAVAMLSGLGILFGLGLAVASRAFAVEADPRVDEVTEVLPGANCGACGHAGCVAYAEAVVLKGASPSECIPGGAATAAVVAGIMGVSAEAKTPRIAVVHCAGSEVASRFEYEGVEDCFAAGLLQGGPKACVFGCLGLGSCVEACPFDAIRMEGGLPRINPDKCVACGKCVSACPRGIIALHPRTAPVQVLCRSTEKGGAVRKICSVGCIGCKKCEKVCPSDAIHVADFLAAVDDEKCTRCGKCVAECPTGSLVMIGAVAAATA